jgi:RNA polymerase sigma-70 factor, ECF subfamily
MADTPQPDDWDLAADATPAAFAELYRRHHQPLYAYIRRRVPTRELAEDLTSDTFLRAWTNLGKVHNIGQPFHAWLFTIARNIIKDNHRRTTTRPDEKLLSNPHIPEPRESEHNTPTDTVDDARTAARTLHASLIGLHPRHQNLLVDRYLYQLTPTEIARRDNVHVTVVKTLQQRALNRLRARQQDVTG